MVSVTKNLFFLMDLKGINADQDRKKRTIIAERVSTRDATNGK